MKDLVNSNVARQNVLNNKYALAEMQKAIGLRGVIFEGELKFTKQQLTSFFEVSSRTIYGCLRNNEQELKKNGYDVLEGNRLKDFELAMSEELDCEVNFIIKTRLSNLFWQSFFMDVAIWQV